MTNPSNAVEKPATGCGCDGDPDGIQLCPLGQGLMHESNTAWRRAVAADGAGDPAAEAKWQRWELAQLAYRDHLGASNG